jgi:hypothetical protein
MFNKLKNLFKPKYLLVYRKEDCKVKTYEISRPDLKNSFANKPEGRNNAGFRAFCFARHQVRNFRHDRVISITKL